MILDLNKIEKTLVRINKELKFEDIQKKNGLFLNGTLDSVKNRLKTKNTYNNKYQNKELNIYETYRWNYWMTLRYKNRKTEYNTVERDMNGFLKLKGLTGRNIIKYMLYGITKKDGYVLVNCYIYTGIETKYDVNCWNEIGLIYKKWKGNDENKKYYLWNTKRSNDDIQLLYNNNTEHLQKFDDYWRSTNRVGFYTKTLKREDKTTVDLKPMFDIRMYRYGQLGIRFGLRDKNILYYLLTNRKVSVVRN
jgi:hypothetical protein